MAIRIVPAMAPKPTDRVQQVMDHQADKQADKNRKRSPNGSPKKLLSLRIDQDVIDHFKATGEGWQSRMNDDLRKAAGL